MTLSIKAFDHCAECRDEYIVILNVIMQNVVMLCHKEECYYAECYYAECHCAECHYTEHDYGQCNYAKCHYAKCHYAELYYAKCHYTECRGAAQIGLALVLPTWLCLQRLNVKKRPSLFVQRVRDEESYFHIKSTSFEIVN